VVLDFEREWPLASAGSGEALGRLWYWRKRGNEEDGEGFL
jgi:hypothetical protein